MKTFSFKFSNKIDLNNYYSEIKKNNDNDIYVLINEDKILEKKDPNYEKLFKKYAYSKNKYGLLVGNVTGNEIMVGIELVIGYRSIVENILKNNILGKKFLINDTKLLNLSFIDQTILDKYFRTYKVIEFDDINDDNVDLSSKYMNFYIIYIKNDLIDNEKYLKHLKKYIKKNKNIHKFQKYDKYIIAGYGKDIYEYINNNKLPSEYHNIDMSIYSEFCLPTKDSYDIFIDETFDFLKL